MWYECENGSAIRPDDVDTTSSRTQVYIRKDITFVEEQTGDNPMPAHYRWMETKVPKDAWAICEQVMAQSNELDALTGVIYTMMGVNTDD